MQYGVWYGYDGRYHDAIATRDVYDGAGDGDDEVKIALLTLPGRL